MIRVTSGISQGRHLSPLLCLTFLLIQQFFSILSLVVFCFSPTMQSSLLGYHDGFLIWCKTVGLSLKEDKCKIMSFYRSRAFIDYSYIINGIPLKRIQESNDLGFIYRPTLSFTSHIDYISCKA